MDSILGSFFFCLTSERLVRYKKYARMRKGRECIPVGAMGAVAHHRMPA